MAKVGIIGGSGVYQMEGIEGLRETALKTPFGEPSDVFRTGTLDGVEVVFLPRHGAGHRLNPSEINYRANIFGMKMLGVENLISISACGSLKKEMKPLDFVLADQFVDRTNSGRIMTFYRGGIVVHVSLADPVCSRLADILFEAGKGLGLCMHRRGTYLNMEGPAFSTRAESNLYRSWGMDIIGMTNMAESRLAREAEMCYVTVAAVTDYDCWYGPEEAVTVEMIIANLTKNAGNAKQLLKAAVRRAAEATSCPCREALKHAIITQKDAVPQKLKKDLAPLIGKYIGT